MAPSQLKQLKASLREKGIIGQQQTKKQKKQNAKTGAAAASRVHRNAVLQELREQFNPFEARAPSRPAKFAVTTNKGNSDPARHRPGVTRGLGEQRRKETLLKEIQSRNKVGILMDRRFGENDPTMTPEERAAERFARESQRRMKKDSMFNLEEDEDEEDMLLTHGGQALAFDDGAVDDFNEKDLNGSDEETASSLQNKRKRLMEEDDMDGLAGASDGEEEQPERKKSKQEVMKEVIAKSKLYKYERQKAKEDDDDLRATLDQGLPDLFEMMKGTPREPPQREMPTEPTMNPDRLALLNGKDRDTADKEYDQRLRQMTFDKRSKPSDRTRTEEEIAEEEAQRLRRLEEERLRRMQGEDDEQSSDEPNPDMEDDVEPDDAKAFGLHQLTTRPDLDVEDEDEFVIEDDLIDSGSAADLSFSDSEASQDSNEADEKSEDDEFTYGLTLPADSERTVPKGTTSSANDASLAYTYPCPTTHEEFLDILEDVKVEDLPTVVQRVRALYHPRLQAGNKEKLGKFSRILVEHVNYLSNQPIPPPFAILENLLRHIHSLAKSYPEDVALAFRAHLREITENRPLNFRSGDLIILTGISTIFPTSDHFHPVVTPSMLLMGRYLGQSVIHSLSDLVTGTYVTSLFLQYQKLSKRYVPEFVNYSLNALNIIAPATTKAPLGAMFPERIPTKSLRLEGMNGSTEIRSLRISDTVAKQEVSKDSESLKLSLIKTLATVLDTAAQLWANKLAFLEVFAQVQVVLEHLLKTCAGKIPAALSDHLKRIRNTIKIRLAESQRARRPLLLHSHRPLAIKTAIPKFEESFNPDRHYDPDRERAELSKLKAEHKRERKGAMRELRKDANFIARESLREKRERDAEYERKYRRLVAEIQSEEGREAKAYEREKRERKGRR